MASLEIINTDIKINNFDKISEFLKSEGIELGRFQLNNFSKEMTKHLTLTDTQRVELINSYPELVNKYSKLAGYRSDVVCLFPEFEHIDMILQKFGDIHFHFENEYWYFFDGYFGFAYLGSHGRKYIVTVEAGEYISVPEGKWQWFYGSRAQRMKSMRFFNTTGKIPEPPAIHLLS